MINLLSMESWQIDYIERNLHVLIERTFVTEALKATLYSQGLLSHEEVQILVSFVYIS